MRILVLIISLFIPYLAFGQVPYEGPMRFSTFWPCNGNGSFCGIRILAEGTIQPDTGRSFEAFLKNRKQHKHELPPSPTVVFNSPGGSLSGGVELGRVIRKNRLDVELADSYSQVSEEDSTKDKSLVERPVCASACVVAFAGGMNRSVQPGAQLGIHQFSGNRANIGDAATQITVVVLASYFEEMGISRSLLDRASLVPSTSIDWVSDGDAKRFRIDNTSPYLEPWKISPTADGDAVLETIQEVSFGRTVSLQISFTQDVGVIAATTRLEKSAIARNRITQFPDNELPKIDICTQIKCMRVRTVKPWIRRDSNVLTVFQATATLSASELREISKATYLKISDNFGNATSDISLSTELSTVGLAPGITLLLRQR